MSGFDVTNYITGKSRGLVDAAKVGSRHVVNVRRFDPTTGDEVDPVTTVIYIKDLELAVLSLEKQISDINELINDLKDLN
jgi:hypothetical protein